jgi:iron complex outermembrane receptor protein
MTTRRKRDTCRGRRLAAVCSSALASIAAPLATAQDSAPIPKIEKIEVTGSRIARIEGESGLPVQVIPREELLDGGVQTMQDVLDRITANSAFGGFTEAKGEGNTIVGFTAASLRGLGSQRTLILLNGRRLAPYALSGGQSVDLSGIPASALDRVEVLKDGASAVYGTDAIGGVINFILRKDFHGAEVNANYFWTQDGGGDNGRVNATAGVGDLGQDKYNFFISADHYKQNALKASQRDSTKTAYIPSLGVDRTTPNSFPANIAQFDFFTGAVYGFSDIHNPTIPFPGGATPGSCARPYSFPTQMSPFLCNFDFASVIETIPEAEKTNVFARFTRQLDSDNQLSADASYYSGKFTQRVSPTPVASYFTSTPMTLPPTSPYYPAAYVAGLPGGDPTQPLELLYRTVELGARADQAKTEQWNVVVGLQGTIGGWDYQVAANYTANRQVDDYIGGYVSESKFGPLLRSGVVNPFGMNSDAVLALMRATEISGQANDNRASNYGADFRIANALFELPAGPLAIALGAEGRRESLEQTNSDFIVSGDVIGGVGAVPSLPTVHRNVGSAFGEANIPIVKGLEGNVALRYDHYSDFGGTTNPKITLRWQPSPKLLLRGSYGTGFRAPTLSDLFQPQAVSFSYTGNVDPVRCPVTGANSPDCSGFISTKSGGNPALQPEKAQQVNAGVVAEPLAGLSAGVDYYWVRVKNVIEIVPLDAIFGDFAHFAPNYVVRKPPDAQYPNLPGPIDYIVQYPTNAGEIRTSGIDINLRWHGPVTAIGRFDLNLNGTYVIDYSHSGFESVAVPPGAGARGPDGPIARYRQYAQLNWTYAAWGATLANNYQSGYTEVDLLTCENPQSELGCTGRRRVGSYTVWDAQARYTGFRNAMLTLGIRNLLNTPPPVSNQGSLSGDFQAGIDPTYADPRGRIYYLAVRYAFQ